MRYVWPSGLVSWKIGILVDPFYFPAARCSAASALAAKSPCPSSGALSDHTLANGAVFWAQETYRVGLSSVYCILLTRNIGQAAVHDAVSFRPGSAHAAYGIFGEIEAIEPS